MTVLGQLLAAQQRPAAEAARITEAIADGIESGGADAADRAYRRELSAIARERCPRPQCPAAVVGFGDPLPDPLSGIGDAEPAGVNLRLDERFLLTAPAPAAAEPAPEPDAAESTVLALIAVIGVASVVMAVVLLVVALAVWVA